MIKNYSEWKECMYINPYSANQNCSRRQILKYLSKFSKKLADDSHGISYHNCYF